MLIQVIRQMNSQSALREAVDEQAEREGLAISTHQKEHRSVFCPLQANRVKAEDFATAVGGISLAGTISYIKF